MCLESLFKNKFVWPTSTYFIVSCRTLEITVLRTIMKSSSRLAVNSLKLQDNEVPRLTAHDDARNLIGYIVISNVQF